MPSCTLPSRLQVAWFAKAFWQLAYDLYAWKLVQEGVLDRLFEQLQRAQIIRIKIEAVPLDSTIVKDRPDGTGALKKAPKLLASHAEYGAPRFIWMPRMLEWL